MFDERKRLLKRYIPDLNDQDIMFYSALYPHLDDYYITNIAEFQNKRNSIIALNFLTYIKKDQDFPTIWNKNEKLIKLTPDFFTNKSIKNFLHHHTSSSRVDNSIWVLKSIRILPEFFTENDIAYNPDWVYYKDYFIFLHPLLLQLNWFWIEFLELYWRTYKKWNRFQISLNFRKVISLNDYRRVEMEKWLWYWKPYSDENLFIKQNKSIFTKLVRDEIFKEINKNWIVFTEFFLDQKNWSFQIEEISEEEVWGFFQHRYIHCLFDLETKTISHLDWSLLFYDKESYISRTQTTLDKTPRYDIRKEKIFRIDWEIDLSKWKSLINNFFIWNELILEYFDKNAYEKLLKKYNENPDSVRYIDYLEWEDSLKEKEDKWLIEYFEEFIVWK